MYEYNCIEPSPSNTHYQTIVAKRAILIQIPTPRIWNLELSPWNSGPTRSCEEIETLSLELELGIRPDSRFQIPNSNG